MTDRLTRTVATALDALPVSLRAVARAAGVSHVLLLQIRRGRLRATPTVARKVAAVLAAWGQTGTRQATAVRRAIAATTQRRAR